MAPYPNCDQLVIFDADGTTIDAFHAIEQSFLRHGMAIGDLARFQKRRKLFKYLGGLREFPNNLRRQFGKQNRKRLLATLTDFYRTETARNSDIPGHGIGLSLTRRIVVSHDGQISVRSQPGEGSTFRIRFAVE